MNCSNSAKCVPILLFLWLKIAINFQKGIYSGMVDIFLFEILEGCCRVILEIFKTVNFWLFFKM